MLIRKVSVGGLGKFGFSVTGDGGDATVSATTTAEGLAVAAQPEQSTNDLPFGRYRIEEHAPQNARGTWRLESVRCGTVLQPIVDGNAVEVNMTSTGNGICTFTNRFTPAGAIRLRKVTLGPLGTTRFQIRPLLRTATVHEQVATTEREGEAVLATGDDSSAIPLGAYEIQESTASFEGHDGRWRVAHVECNGVPVASAEGIIRVTLTAADPELDCTFTNALVVVPPPEPPEPPEPPPPDPTVPGEPSPPAVVPPQGGVLGEIAASLPDLVITKTVRPRLVRLGRLVRYRVTIRNRGNATARDVTPAEQESPSRRFVRLRSSKGSCRGTPPRSCAIGSLRPGEIATVTALVRPRKLGRLRNVGPSTRARAS